MRAILLILLLPCVALAQDGGKDSVQTTDDAGDREHAQRILLTAYRRDEVREQCLRTPDKPIDVAVGEYSITVECAIWTRWHLAEMERLRHEDE